MKLKSLRLLWDRALHPRFWFFLLGLSSKAWAASQYALLLGPSSLGQGGSNALSIPPLAPAEWQFNYVNDEQREWLISLVPGIFLGQRFVKDHLYASLSGGLSFGRDGLGMGVGTAMGLQSRLIDRYGRFQIEYRQVLALGHFGVESPYTVRIGVAYER